MSETTDDAVGIGAERQPDGSVRLTVKVTRPRASAPHITVGTTISVDDAMRLAGVLAGFTPEDVRHLDDAISDAEADLRPEEMSAGLRALRARVEALLPPA